MFAVANDFAQGGLTGISIMLSKLFAFIPVGAAMFALNIPLFVAAYFKIGKIFVLKTAGATLLCTAAIDLGKLFIPAFLSDKILACVFCGVFSGFGIALIMLSGATTGGTEIIAMLARQKRTNISIGRMILLIDLVIISASYFVYRSIESLMYAALSLFVSGYLIDLVLSGAGHSKALFVVTQNPEEVARVLMNTLGRGVTIINAKGGYTGKERSLLFCVARAAQISGINRKIKDTDINSFIVITDVGEVVGNGFLSG